MAAATGKTLSTACEVGGGLSPDDDQGARSTARDEALQWLGRLPHTLAGHANLLHAIVVDAHRNPGVRSVGVRGSVGRGDGDDSTDLDVAIGLDDDRFEDEADALTARLLRVGTLVDHMVRRLPELGALPHHAVTVVFSDRPRLDLVLRPRSGWGIGRRPGVVVLYDPDGDLATALDPLEVPVSPERLREWAMLAWLALAECGRQVRRGAGWGALERLNEARAHGWRVWATARGLPNPERGVYACGDLPLSALPPGVDSTRPDLGDTDILRAALACSSMLDGLWLEATATVMGAPQPRPPIAAWVHESLGAARIDELEPGP